MTPPKVLAKPAVGPATRLARSRSEKACGKGGRDWGETASRGAVRICYCYCLCRRSPAGPQEEEEGEVACSKGACGKGAGASATSGVQEGLRALRSTPSVPSQSARLTSVEPSPSRPVPSERAKGKAAEVSKSKSTEAAASRPASAEKAKSKAAEIAISAKAPKAKRTQPPLVGSAGRALSMTPTLANYSKGACHIRNNIFGIKRLGPCFYYSARGACLCQELYGIISVNIPQNN